MGKPWEQRKFGELYQVNNERNEGKYTFEKTISISTMTFSLNGNGAQETSLPHYKVLRIGDIAFEGHSNKEFRYGRFVLNNLENGIISPRFMTLRPITEQDYNFWEFYIHSEMVMRNYLVKATKAGTMMNELVPNDLFIQSILVPTLEEQTKIGSFFKRFDILITLHQRELDLLKEQKKGLLQKMFPKSGSNVPEIRFPNFTDPWEQRKLGEIAQIKMGQSPDGSTYSETPSDYILIQGNADLLDGWVNPRIWTTQLTKIAEPGDLIMSVRAPAGAMGKTAYKAVIGRGVAAIKGNEFLFQLLSKMDSEGFWKPFSSGSTFESLNSEDIKNAHILLPSLSEQEEIGSFFSNFDSLITLHQRQLDLLKEQKKGLLQKMFPKPGKDEPEWRFLEFR